jgi:hypothetical protein
MFTSDAIMLQYNFTMPSKNSWPWQWNVRRTLFANRGALKKSTCLYHEMASLFRPRNRKFVTGVMQSVIAANRRTAFGSPCLSTYFLVGFVILLIVIMKIVITLWNMMACIPVKDTWRFVRKYRLHFQGGKLRQACRNYAAAVQPDYTALHPAS